MNLANLQAVQKLETRLKDCDFFIQALEGGSPLNVWAGDRGAIMDTYGDRNRFLSAEFEAQLVADITAKIREKRALVVAELQELGVEIS